VEALEALPVAPPPRPAPAPAPARFAAAPKPEVIDLVDEIVDDELPALTPRRASAAAFAPPVTLHPAVSRLAAAQPVAARAAMAAAAALESDPLEADDPIDLDDPIDSPAPAASVAVPLSLGTLAAGEEREIEVPVRVDLEGRILQLHLRLKVRLGR
jgi:hypothetical protein